MVLSQTHFFSEALGVCCTVDVILPQAVPGERKILALGRMKYPTLYLLHGLSDDHTAWQRWTSIERYCRGRNLAVVMPAVNRSFYTDMVSGGRYWTYMTEELPAIVRSLFPLSAARADNFVAGLSMGGYGAFKMALSCPDQYAAAASLSGALDLARLASVKGRCREMEWIFGDLRRFPGSRHDLMALARRLKRSGRRLPRLYQWCGTEDHLYQDNLRFRDHTRAIRFPVTYEESPGGHDWACWDRQIQRVLEWLPTAATRS